MAAKRAPCLQGSSLLCRRRKLRNGGNSAALTRTRTTHLRMLPMEQVFHVVRPASAVEERSSGQLADVSAQLESAVSEAAKTTVKAETRFEP